MKGEELRSVVVTGASTGIGADCARYLDEQGFRVFATVRKQRDAERIAALGSARLEPLFLDVTDSASIAEAAKTVETALEGGELAGLVNNAGISVDLPIECVEVDVLRHQLEVNSVAPVALTQAFLPMLRRSQGRVVNVSSLSGRFANPYSAAYCMSKFALEAFTDSLRRELRAWGIHVASIQPGAIDTAMWEKGLQMDWTEMLSKQQLELYGDVWPVVRKLGEKTAAVAIPSRAVSEAIFHALTAKRPRTRYPVGKDARLIVRLAWLLPDRTMDWFTRKFLGVG
jgi:NAD(P)-dependent dehydrogenase (short-subunit alcohol dehydrogenase family)